MNVALTCFFLWKRFMPFLCIIVFFSACKTIETPINPYDNSLYFSNGRKFSTIPFKMVNNLIIIPLRLNKSDTMNFILDTGVRTALLIGLRTGDSLQLKYARKIKIKGLGEGEDVEAIHSFGNRIDLPGIYGINQDILILLQDVFFFSSKLGMRIHGILGYDMFKNFVVDINYERKELLLRHHSRFKIKKKDNVIPISVEEGKPYVKAKIMSDDNNWVDVKLIVDTGASHALSLDIFSNANIRLPSKIRDAYLGRGLNGDIRGKIGRIKSFHLGGFELDNILTSFPDSASLRHVVDVAERRNGNVGAEILKRFHLTFDYLNQRMIVRPNAYFKKPFVYNMSGIEISTPVPGLPLYVISDIEEDSPAERAGLKKGDQLLYLNNKLAFQYSLNEIIALFQSKAGRKIVISVQRNGVVMRFEFALEKPI
ncbi:aspartyl protease family protein [Thermoflexibacter ruber]|uniref:Aspartyl protease n=1 Tax=Thermoflexibacter ruber TaxID=1003 RepID=A0A1I2C9I2_9BACT|nr:aspartyl protease family protein [Thermoflexibacter ruber]SFE64320.1 Aspartyl protease [Thermoflexibacter ruber]